MKQRIVKIACSFLIMILAMSGIPPLRAAANPGTVTISGYVTYQGRDQNWRAAEEIRIDLYEKDRNQIEHDLASTNTAWNGYFWFGPIENWWYPDGTQLNVFLRIITTYHDSATATDTIVTDYDYGFPYDFTNNPTSLDHDGPWTINIEVSNNKDKHQAMWVYGDLRDAWDFARINYAGIIPEVSR